LKTRRIRIGTRGSKLALWQTHWVKDALIGCYPDIEIDLVTIKTKGDKITDVPLASIGGSAMFVKELEQALMDQRIDVAVHSMKDMPSKIPDALAIGAIPERESPWDVLISKTGIKFSQLPSGARIGTSSLRRRAQCLHIRPDLCIESIRGNLDTRIRKLDTEPFDAILVAAAGVRRLDLQTRITEYLPPDIMLPAVGQGALCVEIRKADSEVAQLVATLDHPVTRTIVTAERAFLTRLGGSCQVPMAAHAKLFGRRLIIDGLVAAPDGKPIFRDSVSGLRSEAESLGALLSDRLVSMGASEILEQIMSEANTP